MATTAQWRNPAKLGRFVRLMQWPLAVTAAAMFLSDLAVVGAASGLPSGLDESDPAAVGVLHAVVLNGLASLINTLVLLVAGFASLKWIYRTNRNAHLWAEDMRVTPGWGVGWFFVPVAFLWKPFQGVSETWRVSDNPVGWGARAEPALLRWWWAAFLVQSLVGNVAGRLSLSAHTVSGEVAMAVVSLVSDAAAILLAAVFWRVVKRIDALQATRHAQSAPVAAAPEL